MATVYDVTIEQLANGQRALQIAREGATGALFQWSGEVARRVIAWSGVQHGQHLGKHQVRELAVAASAASCSIGTQSADIVEKVVRQHAGQHLSEEDLLSVCFLEHPAASAVGLKQALRRLVATNRIQRIEIDPAHVFYDADTRAHLHVFDPTTGRLFDAPENGVIVGRASLSDDG